MSCVTIYLSCATVASSLPKALQGESELEEAPQVFDQQFGMEVKLKTKLVLFVPHNKIQKRRMTLQKTMTSVDSVEDYLQLMQSRGWSISSYRLTPSLPQYRKCRCCWLPCCRKECSRREWSKDEPSCRKCTDKATWAFLVAAQARLCQTIGKFRRWTPS